MSVAIRRDSTLGVMMSKESDTAHHLSARWESLGGETAALGNKILNECASVALDDGWSEICGVQQYRVMLVCVKFLG